MPQPKSVKLPAVKSSKPMDRLERIERARAKSDQATIRLSVEVPADVYGLLCRAALVHGVSWQEAAQMLLEHYACLWCEDGFATSL